MSSHQQPFDDPERGEANLTDADVTSETRFGPRPVPKGHRPARDRLESRRIPPHGEVSPDGSRAYPRPSRLAKWMVLGGTGIAAAALTAGTVLAARQLSDMLGGDGRAKRRPQWPYRPDDAPTPRMHLSEPAEPEPTSQKSTSRPGRKRPRASLMDEIEANTATLTHSVDNVMRTVTSAVAGFRAVAAQSSEIVREFGDAADLVRDILERNSSSGKSRSRTRAQGFRPGHDGPKRPFHPAPKDPLAGDHPSAPPPDLRDDPLVHDPAEGPEDGGPSDHDPRRHRL
ncbi:hypothetical protein RGQ15_09235 [Paracoccus sp. MBLB3053]|uniref:Uncharacterized protein n=1 Tax=Paracoccus aurantius TaxID=3073814 RepID=A0ABU2HRR8_9RHOB|nr:hypothetical protein [Paracoccus sp. MBLB3053]MDS9467748.1 hypothetical protein [Paracoccus sp. MBLB3053]